jgi:hypothetical protein
VRDMNGKTVGNLILMTLVCVIIFWVFMAFRPARADFMQGVAGMAIVQERCNNIAIHPKLKAFVQSVRASSPQQFQASYDSFMSQAKETIRAGMPESVYWPMWCMLIEPSVEQLHKEVIGLLN